MKLEIINTTGRVCDTIVRNAETGETIPVTKIEIAPMGAEHGVGFGPAVTITVPRASMHLVSEDVTVHEAMECLHAWALTRDEALAWFKRVPDGTAIDRAVYREQFGVGNVAAWQWDDPAFTLGVEYGIRMALAKTFDIKPEEV